METVLIVVLVLFLIGGGGSEMPEGGGSADAMNPEPSAPAPAETLLSVTSADDPGSTCSACTVARNRRSGRSCGGGAVWESTERTGATTARLSRPITGNGRSSCSGAVVLAGASTRTEGGVARIRTGGGGANRGTSRSPPTPVDAGSMW